MWCIIHSCMDTVYPIILPRIVFSIRPVSYPSDKRIRDVSNTYRAKMVYVKPAHLRNHRYTVIFITI